MMCHVKNENFILDSTSIFRKSFHFLPLNGSFVFPESILTFGLIHLVMIDLTSVGHGRPHSSS
ncbi:hypothetical protein ZWY2020_058170 [Hordeum vulgare]|nr:hypothetical protein ZWY2020_058170 [Hordeum vulgare]